MNKDMAVGELKFSAVRSGGAGGQHVNKVATKVVLHFDVEKAASLSPEEKERLLKKLRHRISGDGQLVLTCNATRSQHRNREIATGRFLHLIEKSLAVPKKRKRTAPSKAVRERRMEEKRKTGEKKAGRRKPDIP